MGPRLAPRFTSHIHHNGRDMTGYPPPATRRPAIGRREEAAKRAPEGPVLAKGDSDCCDDADRFSVSGTASWVKGRLGWYPITVTSKKQSTVALGSGEAELVAALSGTCEGMGLRQQWNWLRKSGNNAEETCSTSQQILCCDSSAAVSVTKRNGSTRKPRHIELKAFFLQQWRARQEMRLVQVKTDDMLADCLTKVQTALTSIQPLLPRDGGRCSRHHSRCRCRPCTPSRA